MARVPKEIVRAQLKEVVAAAPVEMQLTELLVHNIQKIKFAHIRPKGNVIVVGGRNGQGKTSLLQSIAFLLCGPELLPTDVIRAGEKTATITGQVGPFKITRYFSRKSPDQGINSKHFLTKIKVFGPMGEEYPRRRLLLDMLLQQVSFDPLEFMRMEPKYQLERLKQMSRFEVDGQPFNLDELDGEQEADYNLRRELRYRADSVNTRLKALLTDVCPECNGTGMAGWKGCEKCNHLGMLVPEAPPKTTAVDLAALTQQLEEAAAHNAEVATARAERERLEARALEQKEEARQARDKAQHLLDAAEAIDGVKGVVQVFPDTWGYGTVQSLLEQASKVIVGELIDTAKVAEQLKAAMAEGEEARKARAIQELNEERTTAWAEWLVVQERMKARGEQRSAILQSAKMPVAGLGIGDDEVTYNGRPLSQASGAEKIRVSLAIGMTTNPKLRILRFLDGGWDMLDEESQGLVRETVATHRFQLWVEHVGVNGNSTVMMEEGEATGTDTVTSQVTR